MKIVNKFLLAGDKIMHEMHKQEFHDIFTKTKKINLVFNMTWLMEILKIQLEEQLLIKYCVIKHLRLLKIRNMMDIKGVILQWFINLLIIRLLVEVFKMIISSF